MHQAVHIPAGPVTLEGIHTGPPRPDGVVVFVHGGGSSRHSARDRYVAAALNRVGYATVLMDLLTATEIAHEHRSGRLRLDTAFLARRVGAATDWLIATYRAEPPPLFLFGASTGAAAALRCAADRPTLIHGVVSRGGRPDLAADVLPAVHPPTLLIVGGNDPAVLAVNEQAKATISSGGGTVELVVVPGATHLFEEYGALDAVIDATVPRLCSWRWTR